MTNKKVKNNDDEVKIKKKKSSLSEFIQRSLPSDKEVAEFEELVSEEAKEEEIEESLSEIYQDDNGEMVDVSKMNIKKKRGFLFKFFSFFVVLFFVAVISYSIYYYFTNNPGSSSVEFSIEGEEKIVAGEEFFYKINYRNPSNVNVKNVRIDVNFPDSFVFLDSLPAMSKEDGVWYIDSIVAKTNSSIKIKGKIIAKEDSSAIILAEIRYTPDNFSSEFKEETSFASFVNSIGMDVDFSYPSTALVGEENEIEIEIQGLENNYLKDFIIEAEEAENIEYITYEKNDSKKNEEKESNTKIVQIKPNVWKVIDLDDNIETVIAKYKIKEKVSDEQEIKFVFKQNIKETSEATSSDKVLKAKDYIFLEKNIVVDVMKSDLNLSLEINGSKADQGVNFEDQLNYKISYINKGDETMKDIVIMAVLDSDFLDWTTLKDENKGREKGNTIFWTKTEIPELEEVEKNQSGEINFSINVLPFREMDLGENFEIKSYAQYSIGDKDEVKENNDNRSNEIVNKINSDLNLAESVRYFNDDNIPVGTGPLPPKVGETTSFKVYWTVTNNIHELNNAQVEVVLPEYVTWNEKSRNSVGSIFYDSDTRIITWQIGRMPISVYRADAEFSISLTPGEDDRNKIMVLLPGATVSATDNETGADISKTTSPKTTKLEDDEIAQMSNDGRVE